VSGEARGPGAVLARLGLWGLSTPYGLTVRARNLLYDRGWLRSQRAGVPVISVGNLTAGGTGKTPCVEYVARYLRERELRVAILSRGYGGAGGPNDEALVLEENLPDVPHLQGPDRVALAEMALEELQSEVLVLDDAFQHRRLARELDIVLVDALSPWGYGHVLPRGLLREPVRSLRRASVVVLTRCDQVRAADRAQLRAAVAAIAPEVPLVETAHRPVEWLNSAGQTAALDLGRDRPVAAFCGIGNPEAFRRTLAALGVTPAAFRTYPDHHPYPRDDVRELQSWARALPADALLVTTQKDLVKLRVPELGGRPLWALRIALAVEVGEPALHQALDRVIALVDRSNCSAEAAGH
jgi:tetraacyldisaccharide 4'-kinase